MENRRKFGDRTQDSVDLQQRRQIDKICDDFESMLRGDNPPQIEGFLKRHPDVPSAPLLRELLRLEIDWNHAQGAAPVAGDYAERFASFTDLVRSVFEDDEATIDFGSETSRLIGTSQSTRDHFVGDTDFRSKETPLAPGRIGRYSIERMVAPTSGVSASYFTSCSPVHVPFLATPAMRCSQIFNRVFLACHARFLQMSPRSWNESVYNACPS